MTVYYNEIDPYAAQWLRNLIAAEHLAKGEVDERSITEIQPDDLLGFDQCHFFAGIGVWGHALRRAGWADDRPVWTGSCPCQPFSAAGKQEGFADARHLWPIWFNLIRQCRPAIVLGEQVASALDWLDLVSTDMEDAGYAFGAADLCAAGFGGAHIRQRLYFTGVANTVGSGRARAGGQSGAQSVGTTERGMPCDWENADWLFCSDGTKRPSEPGSFPLVDAAASRVGRLRAYGNGLDAETATQFVAAVMDCAP
jgi:DNA (cytosine-5)-methyltransferase 1